MTTNLAARTLAPDAGRHRLATDHLLDLRLGQLARLAPVLQRLPIATPAAIGNLLGRLPELDAGERLLLADDPIFHASVTRLINGLRSTDGARVRTALTRLVATALLPAARLVSEPVELTAGTDGLLSTYTGGPQLALGSDAVGSAVTFTGDGSGLAWSAAGRRSGCLRLLAVPGPFAAAPRTVFGGNDERLPGMLHELGTDPDGFAVEEATQVRVTDQLTGEVAAGLDALARCWPQLSAEIAQSIRLIVPVNTQRIAAFSNTAWQGAVFLRADMADLLFLVERLVHESAHVRLNAEMAVTDFHLHESGDRVDSPFRRGPRPVAGLIHGAYVFTRAAEALLRVAAGTAEADRAAAQARALLDKVGESLQTIEAAVRLSGPGELLLAEITDRHRELLLDCGGAAPTANPSAYLLDEL